MPNGVFRNCSASAKPKPTAGAIFCARPKLPQTLCLRRLYLEHAIDEFRHGVLFRRRAAALLNESPASFQFQVSRLTGLRLVATVSTICRLTGNRTTPCWLFFIYRRRLRPAASRFIAT